MLGAYAKDKWSNMRKGVKDTFSGKEKFKFQDPHAANNIRRDVSAELYADIIAGKTTTEELLETFGDSYHDFLRFKNTHQRTLYNDLLSPRKFTPDNLKNAQEIYDLFKNIDTQEEFDARAQERQKKQEEEQRKREEEERRQREEQERQRQEEEEKKRQQSQQTNQQQAGSNNDDRYGEKEFKQNPERLKEYNDLDSANKNLFDKQIQILQKVHEINQTHKHNQNDAVKEITHILIYENGLMPKDINDRKEVRRKVAIFYHPDKYSTNPDIVKNLMEKIFKEAQTIQP